MSSEDFDPEAVAARAAGDDPDVGAGDEDVVDDDEGDEGDEWEIADTVGGILLVLVAADERGPSARTIQQKLDVDEGPAYIVDGLTDLVLEIVDADVGDSVGPLGKMAVGFSRMGDDVVDAGAGDEAVDDVVPETDGDLSREAREVMGGQAGV
jgi:hypothetical protein